MSQGYQFSGMTLCNKASSKCQVPEIGCGSIFDAIVSCESLSPILGELYRIVLDRRCAPAQGPIRHRLLRHSCLGAISIAMILRCPFVHYNGEQMTDLIPMRHVNRDTDHLNILRRYFAQNRRIPSYQRIADLLGFASRAAAVKFMGRMEAEGFVARTVDDDAWMPARRFFEHPLAQATVQAGQPTVAIDVSAEPFLFDDYHVKKPADTVVVPVQGDSMIEAGIFEGDLAVVERAASAKLGSFVVARVEDRFPLKELVKVDGAHAQPVERASHACRARARAGRDSAQAALRSRRCRGQRRVPGFGRCRLHHRRHARSQRRSGHGVSTARPPEVPIPQPKAGVLQCAISLGSADDAVPARRRVQAARSWRHSMISSAPSRCPIGKFLAPK